ncbi:hypothetical protein ACWD6I_01975 [Streptomyces sp. NPDC002454]
MSADRVPATPAQGSHQYVLTLDLPGRAMSTWSGTLTPGSRDTRQDVYQWLRKQITDEHPHFATACVVVFSLEPNHL